LVQVRDDIPGIFYPGHCGLIGGAVDAGESYAECAAREMKEEIGLEPSLGLTHFLDMILNFAPLGHGAVERVFFECRIAEDILSLARLTEGQRLELVSGEDLLRRYRITPYDAFALWQHWTIRFGST